CSLGEEMHVEEIEEFRPDLESQSLGGVRVLLENHIHRIERGLPDVADAAAYTGIEAKYAAGRTVLKRIPVQQRAVFRIVIADAGNERVGAGQHARQAAHSELAGDGALPRINKEWDTGLRPEDGVYCPSRNNLVRESSRAPQEPMS